MVRPDVEVEGALAAHPPERVGDDEILAGRGEAEIAERSGIP